MNNLVELHETTGLFKIEGNDVVIRQEAAEQIADFLKFIKMLKTEEDQLKKMLLDEMEQFGILSIGTDDFAIRYVAEYDKISLDHFRLKEECPDIYDAYCKVSTVKPSVRVQLK